MSPDRVLPHAARLVCGVAERNPAETHAVLLSLDVEGLRALAVVLAASVDPGQPLGQLEADPAAGTVGRVVLAVSLMTGIPGTLIYGRDRTREVSAARMVVCWVASALGLSSVAIGAALRRDHSTVLSATSKVTATPELYRVAQRVLADVQPRDRKAA